MSRPMLLVFLLLILIITSQFEWRQQLVDIDSAPSVTQKQQQISRREEAVKEKVTSLVHFSTLSVVVRKQLNNEISCIGIHTFYMVYYMHSC